MWGVGRGGREVDLRRGLGGEDVRHGLPLPPAVTTHIQLKTCNKYMGEFFFFEISQLSIWFIFSTFLFRLGPRFTLLAEFAHS